MNSQELIALIRAASSQELEQLVLRYGHDPRVGVTRALAAAKRKAAQQLDETRRLDALYARLDAADPGTLIVGLDEVGRGALAGPLLVAAVALPARPRVLQLNDSKQLSASQREKLAAQISELALAIGISAVPPTEIDRIGMAAALRLAFTEALEKTDLDADLVLIDGHPLRIDAREKAIIGGDSLEASIAAASIVAKVRRDAMMSALAESYPQYELAANKGYASASHIAALQKYGASDIHRTSFLTSILSGQERLF